MSHSTTTKPAYALRRLLRAIHTPGIGVTSTSVYVLAELAHFPGVSIAELARRCRHGGRSIERPIAALRREGYIEAGRRGRAVSGRPVVLSVTARGWELLTALEGVAQGKESA